MPRDRDYSERYFPMLVDAHKGLSDERAATKLAREKHPLAPTPEVRALRERIKILEADLVSTDGELARLRGEIARLRKANAKLRQEIP